MKDEWELILQNKRKFSIQGNNAVFVIILPDPSGVREYVKKEEVIIPLNELKTMKKSQVKKIIRSKIKSVEDIRIKKISETITNEELFSIFGDFEI